MNTENVHHFNDFKNNVYAFKTQPNIYIYIYIWHEHVMLHKITLVKFVKSQKLQNTFNMCQPWF